MEHPTNDKKDAKANKQRDKTPDTKEGYVTPIDIVGDSQSRCPRYTNLFREFTHLSNRQKAYLKSSNDLVPDGCCMKIMEIDFEAKLAPFVKEDLELLPFNNDNTINKFGMFVWKVLEACESGSIGGDACRMGDVLLAAIDDVSRLRTQEHIEHLLGLTMAIQMHGLRAFLERGDPGRGRLIFGEMAKMWKKFFDPVYDHSLYNISDAVREYAQTICADVQYMLKNAKKNYGEYATKYNFNYIRIPRPKRAKAAQQQKENAEPSATNSNGKRDAASGDGDTAAAAKKKKKPLTEAMKLIERISAVEGVPEDKVYDSCPEIRSKIKTFLKRDGVTKTNLCVALGNINHNSLNRFLSAVDQKQSGNAAYKNGYVFFEKLRVLEGKAKSSERLWNEQNTEDGYDFSKPKGGRPGMIFYDPRFPIGGLC